MPSDNFKISTTTIQTIYLLFLFLHKIQDTIFWVSKKRWHYAASQIEVSCMFLFKAVSDHDVKNGSKHVSLKAPTPSPSVVAAGLAASSRSLPRAQAAVPDISWSLALYSRVPASSSLSAPGQISRGIVSPGESS